MANNSVTIKINGDTSGIERSTSKTEGLLGRLGSGLGGVAGAMGKAFAVMGAAGGAAIGYGVKIAADNETAKISFTQLLGDAQKADAFIVKMKDFAAKTPFELAGLQESSSRLLAVGVEADKVIPIMSALGDSTAAMGTGSEGIQRAVMALGQMQVKGKVTGEEMMQLTEAGIPAWDALASVMGTDVATAQKKVSEGQVKVNDLMAAIETRAGPAMQRVSGMMDKQSASLSGMFATLKDTVGQGLADLTAPLAETLKSLMGPLQGMLQEMGGFLEPIITQVGGMLTPILQNLMYAFQQLGPPVSLLVTTIGGGLTNALQIIMPSIVNLLAHLMPLIQLAAEFGSTILSVLAPAFSILLNALLPIVDAIGGALQESFKAIEPMIPDLAKAFEHLALAFAEIMVALVPLIPPLVKLLTSPVLIHGLVIAIEALASGMELWLKVATPFIEVWSKMLNGDFAGAMESADKWRGKLLEILGGIVDWLESVAVPALIEGGKQLGAALFAWIAEQIPTIPGKLWGIALAIGAWILTEAVPWVGTQMLALAEKFVAWIIPTALALPGQLMAIGAAIVNWLFTTAIPWAVGALAELAGKFVGWIIVTAIRLPGDLAAIGTAIVNWVVGTAIPWAVGALVGLANAFVDWVGNAVANLPGNLANLAGVIVDFAASLPGRIVSAIGNLSGLLLDAGRAAIDGLKQGALNAVGNLGGFFASVKDKFVGGLMSAFGIKSPARVMMPIGINIVGGMSEGMRQATPDVLGLAQGLANRVAAAGSASASFSGPGAGYAESQYQVGMRPTVEAVLTIDRRVLASTQVDAADRWDRSNR